MSDPYVVFMQILTTKKEGNTEVADKIQVILLSTDTTKSLQERMQKTGSPRQRRTGLVTPAPTGATPPKR